MKDSENKNPIHIQEYECGQKTDLYRLDDEQTDPVNISTRKKQSTTSLTSLFRAFFYPDNYPLGKIHFIVFENRILSSFRC